MLALTDSTVAIPHPPMHPTQSRDVDAGNRVVTSPVQIAAARPVCVVARWLVTLLSAFALRQPSQTSQSKWRLRAASPR
jgi:hypothetical protein